MPANIKLILIGDIVAKIGRRVTASVLPAWQKQYQPDAIIANIENLAHGKGITSKSIGEIKEFGITACTGGNHAWKKTDPAEDEIRTQMPVAMPANDSRTIDPMKWQEITLGKEKLFVLNLIGQAKMPDEGTENPFLTFDTLYEKMNKPKLLVVDLHAELTSEKVAFGHYVDGRASVMYGTHTHIPTADTRILPQGTGYITDVGMTGSNDSVIGVQKEIIINRFLNSDKEPFEYPENGPAWMNAIYCEIDTSSGKCIAIKHITKTFTIN